MANDAQAWADSISEWCADSQQDTSAAVAKTARNLYKMIVQLSPSPSYTIGGYSQGHFMKNYRIGPTAQVGEITGLETESQALARIDRQIPDDYFLLYDKVTMTNSTPYITEIEYKGWKRTGAYMPIATALSMFLN